MLRVAGGTPVAIRVRGNRWIYGIARFADGELRWYRAIGVGTRPTRSLARTDLSIVSHRAPTPDELGSLPAAAVIVECTDSAGARPRPGATTLLRAPRTATFAFSESAFTGFVSWLESSSPG